MKNPKLGFESPEPGEHFKNTSFFEKKKYEKKKVKIFSHFTAIFLTVSVNTGLPHFKGVEFFVMSSYGQNFLRTFTFDISAFKRTISHVSTTSRS